MVFRRIPHIKTIFHLVPHEESPKAQQMLHSVDNQRFVSLCKQATRFGETEKYGLEIGYHVSESRRARVIVEVGKNGDLVMPGSSISQVHFSFEIHPESDQIMFVDRSRLNSTKIEPDGFRGGGNFRQVVLKLETQYLIRAGGEKMDQYVFHLIAFKGKDGLAQQLQSEFQAIEAWGPDPRLARTVEDTPTDLSTWYNTRLHTPAIGAVQRTVDIERLGGGAFGEVFKAVDCDSGRTIAVKKVKLPRNESGAIDQQAMTRLQWEVKILSTMSHVCSVTYYLWMDSDNIYRKTSSNTLVLRVWAPVPSIFTWSSNKETFAICSGNFLPYVAMAIFSRDSCMKCFRRWTTWLFEV